MKSCKLPTMAERGQPATGGLDCGSLLKRKMMIMEAAMAFQFIRNLEDVSRGTQTQEIGE